MKHLHNGHRVWRSMVTIMIEIIKDGLRKGQWFLTASQQFSKIELDHSLINPKERMA
jgi:hypothetical protein